MIKILRIAALVSLVVILAAFAFWFKPWAWPKFYDEGVAISIVLLSFVVWRATEDKWLRVIGFVYFWFAINNVVDEIFFNPEETGWNEYVFAIIILTTTAWRLLRKKRI